MRHEEFHTDILKLAFTIYRDYGLARSQSDFSTRILGMRPAYLSSMTARGRKPSWTVLARLRDNVAEQLTQFLINPHLGQPYAAHVNLAHRRLQVLDSIIQINLNIPN